MPASIVPLLRSAGAKPNDKSCDDALAVRLNDECACGIAPCAECCASRGV